MAREAPGIEHSFSEVLVADWPRAVRWYVEVLELRLVVEDVAREFALLGAGSGRIALKGGDRPSGAPTFVRLVFRVADVDAQRDRLVALGIDVEPPADNLDEGYRGIGLRDPEGTPITLF